MTTPLVRSTHETLVIGAIHVRKPEILKNVEQISRGIHRGIGAWIKESRHSVHTKIRRESPPKR